MVLGLAVSLHSSVRVQDYQGLRRLLAGRTYVIEKINLFTKPFDVIREITLSLWIAKYGSRFPWLMCGCWSYLCSMEIPHCLASGAQRMGDRPFKRQKQTASNIFAGKASITFFSFTIVRAPSPVIISDIICYRKCNASLTLSIVCWPSYLSRQLDQPPSLWPLKIMLYAYSIIPVRLAKTKITLIIL